MRVWDETDLRYIDVEVIFSGGGPLPWQQFRPGERDGWFGYQSPVCNARPYKQGELISLDSIRDKGTASSWRSQAMVGKKKRKAA